MKMVFTAIELIALIAAILTLIKIGVVALNKKIWFNKVTKKVYGSKNSACIFFIILAVVIFIFLLQSLTLVEIFACMTLSFVLLALGFIQFNKDTIKFGERIMKKKFPVSAIIYIIFWVILAIAVIYQVLK